MTRPLALLALLASSALAAPAGAFDIAAMSEAERGAFRAEIRAYLLDNPEVLMEAIGVLEERQAAETARADESLVADNAAALFETPGQWVGGNPDGDITMVEFVDYRCGYCRRAHDDVKELVSSDGNIRFLLKEFPILGDASTVSSRFALATRMVEGDAAYGAVQDALIGLKPAPGEKVLLQLAKSLDLDGKAILSAMENPEIDRIISENRALAGAMQINGTPTFVIGDELLRGYVPLDAMRGIVADLREDG
ncbi:DsbA family protein [Poseidonocella sedimentorum]|uniref:Protein-disulfide isomerase n=1 Tax=Poseidonocella sedimentorum TaxID=871652 RepID=A0A1I6CNB8_9RHOB|nr:DsbA family protein [Poseidonocella sedimentorum]SFQ94684.1 Protein-disulfide isomerase [Poseidonocella sedimentorum]